MSESIRANVDMILADAQKQVEAFVESLPPYDYAQYEKSEEALLQHQLRLLEIAIATVQNGASVEEVRLMIERAIRKVGEEKARSEFVAERRKEALSGGALRKSFVTPTTTSREL